MIVLILIALIGCVVDFYYILKYNKLYNQLNNMNFKENIQKLAILKTIRFLKKTNNSQNIDILKHWLIYGSYPEPIFKIYSKKELIFITKKFRECLLL